MLKLMKLELERNHMKTYMMAAIIVTVVMTGLLFLFAYVPQVDPDPDMQKFAGYQNLIPMFSILVMSVFATFSAVMYTRFIIEEYKEKRAILLFCYPVSKTKVLLAKLVVVFLFIFFGMLLCNTVAFGVFGGVQVVVPLVSEQLSTAIIFRLICVTITTSLTAASVGIIAVTIGFVKKSVPATIIAAVLLSSLFCNVMFNFGSDIGTGAFLGFMGVTLMLGISSSLILMNKVKKMEV